MISKIPKIFPLMIIILLSVSPVSASLLIMDFSVDVNQYWTGSSYTDPDIMIDYSVFVDTSSPTYIPDPFLSGGTFAQSKFSPSVIPETQFTDDVLSNIVAPIGEYSSTVELHREYSPTGYSGSGLPETFEGVFFDSGAHSPIINNQWTSYYRGLQRQMVIGDGNLVQTFSPSEYQAYMESLIGDSNFSFGDYFLISEWFPDLDYSNTIYQYGYGGVATLTGVGPASAPIPEPTTMLLLGTGLVGIVGSRLRKKKIAQ